MTKILLLAANPKDISLLKLSQEIREIDREVHHAKFGDQFKFEPKVAVRLRDLSEYLDEVRPDIVHFSGHGNSASEIVLEDESGNSHPVSREAIKGIFSLLKGKIRCVVLNACYAESQADVLAEEIDCVVGMFGTINDKAAIEFAREFYRQLANGKDVGTAFKLGRTQIPNGQDVARLLAFKANPSKVVFTKKKQWVKYVTSLVLVIGLALVFSAIWNGWLQLPLISPASQTPTTQSQILTRVAREEFTPSSGAANTITSPTLGSLSKTEITTPPNPTELPLVVQSIVCIIAQKASGTPAKVSRDSFFYSSSASGFNIQELPLTSGQKIPFSNMKGFEALEINEKTIGGVKVGITLLNEELITGVVEHSQYDSTSLTGVTTYGAKFDLRFLDVKRVDFLESNCQ